MMPPNVFDEIRTLPQQWIQYIGLQLRRHRRFDRGLQYWRHVLPKGNLIVKLSLLALILPFSARGQVNFSDMVTFSRLQVTVCKDGPLVEDLGDEILPLSEVIEAISGDPDGDGVPSLLDPCPQNPFCTSRDDVVDFDGDGHPLWGDVDDTNPNVYLTGDPIRDGVSGSSNLTLSILQYSGPAAIGDAALAENQSLGLYPAKPMIDAAEAAGIDSSTVSRWRSVYGGN